MRFAQLFFCICLVNFFVGARAALESLGVFALVLEGVLLFVFHHFFDPLLN